MTSIFWGDLVPNEKSKQSYGNFSDLQLADMIKHNNDNDAFEEIVVRYVRLIASIATKYRAEGFEINDFIQEGLLTLLNACKTYNENSGASFKNYATICVENKFISILRKSQIKSAIPKDNLVPIDEVELSDDNATNPEQLVLNKETLDGMLVSLKSKLSPLELQVFSLYLAGCNYIETSRRLNLSVKSVDNALQRIRKKLNT